MKDIIFDLLKNQKLRELRNIDFNTIITIMAEEPENLLDILEHPNKEKYPSQKIFVLLINNYIFLVPFVENEKYIFLKTIIPSRKFTKKYQLNK